MATDQPITDDLLEQRLRTAARRRQGSYTPRTAFLDDCGEPVFINRLILENSPYLLQHAHNPVDWFPWGDEAFAEAQAQDKPVFLSIGYSTCHWCHVMEVESFDNPDIAAILNEDFIAIKLDREQHPDIDDVYMTAVQMVSGHGGWPMSNFLLPDGNPFFGATYFPPQQFAALLRQVAALWSTRREELQASAGRLQTSLSEALEHRGAARDLDADGLDRVVGQLLEREDRGEGGLAGAPKFPQEPLLLYWLQRAATHRNLAAAGFVSRALQAMGSGGICDQVGGGFHRYSVDAQWLVPHFEKMLYNQSQLGLACLQAWQLTGNSFFRRLMLRTMDYVLREMQLPEGGFYSATDADSEDEEGRFFVWTLAELGQVLNESERQTLARFCPLPAEGNFEGAIILTLDRTQLGPDPEAALAPLEPVLEKLRRAREQRIKPLRDDKLIVAWAAAMATTLVQAGQVLGRPDYVEAARRAISLICRQCNTAAAGLQRIYLAGEVSMAAQLEDYANLLQALLALNDADAARESDGAGQAWLTEAQGIAQQMLEHCWDEPQGGFCTGPARSTGPRLVRSRSAADGATLAAVATALEGLVGLQQRAAIVPDQQAAGPDLRHRIETCIAAHGAAVVDNPPAHVSFLRAVEQFRQGPHSLPAWLAGGRVRVDLDSEERTDTRRSLTLSLHIAPGWHLAAPDSDHDTQALSLHPLQLHLADDEPAWTLETLDYPTPGSTADYRGQVQLTVHLQRTAVRDLLSHSTGLVLSLQACSEQSCLAIQTLRLRL